MFTGTRRWAFLLNIVITLKKEDKMATFVDEGSTVWNNIEVHSALQTLKILVNYPPPSLSA